MKRIISFLLVIFIVFTLCCSCEKQEDNVVEVDTAEAVAAQIGATFVIPSTAKYTDFSVIDDSVGEARFTFNGYVFVYRASKVRADAELHEKGDDYTATAGITIDTRAEVKIYSYDKGGRVAVWNFNGTNYTLFSEKNPSNDTFTELCDLLIR